MGNVYVVTYLTPDSGMMKKLRRSQHPGIVGDFARAVTEGHWPYDGGDDPSFFAWQKLRGQGGKLTWGVCRTDVRRVIRPGDVAAFFAYERRSNTELTQNTYLFVGYATVQTKVSPETVWTNPGLIACRSYLNHLIQPDGNAYIHSEPVPGQCHKDWLWRIADISGWGKGKWKTKFETQGKLGKYEPGKTQIEEGWPVAPGKTYVFFEPDLPQTYILRRPIPVAQYSGEPKSLEVWFQDDIAQGIRERCLWAERCLRTKNQQQPHRHIKFAGDAKSWVGSMASLLEASSFAAPL